MNKRVLYFAPILVLAMLMPGCVAGYNSMLFATKTNVGLVVDTQPPEVNLDIGRFEGVLAPATKMG